MRTRCPQDPEEKVRLLDGKWCDVLDCHAPTCEFWCPRNRLTPELVKLFARKAESMKKFAEKQRRRAEKQAHVTVDRRKKRKVKIAVRAATAELRKANRKPAFVPLPEPKPRTTRPMPFTAAELLAVAMTTGLNVRAGRGQ